MLSLLAGYNMATTRKQREVRSPGLATGRDKDGRQEDNEEIVGLLGTAVLSITPPVITGEDRARLIELLSRLTAQQTTRWGAQEARFNANQ